MSQRPAEKLFSPRGQVVVTDHTPPVGEQAIDEMAADETGGSGDECIHGSEGLRDDHVSASWSAWLASAMSPKPVPRRKSRKESFDATLRRCQLRATSAIRSSPRWYRSATTAPTIAPDRPSAASSR